MGNQILSLLCKHKTRLNETLPVEAQVSHFPRMIRHGIWFHMVWITWGICVHPSGSLSVHEVHIYWSCTLVMTFWHWCHSHQHKKTQQNLPHIIAASAASWTTDSQAIWSIACCHLWDFLPVFRWNLKSSFRTIFFQFPVLSWQRSNRVHPAVLCYSS